MQGFLFSKPLPVAEFLSLVTTQHKKLSTLINFG
jgi:sensor c-di-GMP phosphodiesterase-like protein